MPHQIKLLTGSDKWQTTSLYLLYDPVYCEEHLITHLIFKWFSDGSHLSFYLPFTILIVFNILTWKTFHY